MGVRWPYIFLALLALVLADSDVTDKVVVAARVEVSLLIIIYLITKRVFTL